MNTIVDVIQYINYIMVSVIGGCQLLTSVSGRSVACWFHLECVPCGTRFLMYTNNLAVRKRVHMNVTTKTKHNTFMFYLHIYNFGRNREFILVHSLVLLPIVQQ